MLELITDNITNTRVMAAVFAAVGAVATVLTLAMPLLATDTLGKRMKSVALEREKLRQRERERLARGEKVTLRQSPKQYMQRIVEQFNLKKWVGQEEARALLVQAGYRGQAPYITYLFFRMVMPAAMLVSSLFYVFVVLELDQTPVIKVGMCLAATYFGMYLPSLFLKNKIARRQLSIRRAFPDSLDLLLICVESGMSIEAGFKKVAHGDRLAVDPARRGIDAHDRRTLLSAGSPPGLREPRQAHQSRRRQVGLHGAAAGGALRHADGADAARDGAGKPRHAHVGSREEGRRPAAEAHGADDPVLPAGAVHRHPWSGRDQGDADESDELTPHGRPLRRQSHDLPQNHATLILRSAAKRHVSKDGSDLRACRACFETRPAVAPQHEEEQDVSGEKV